MFKNESLRFNHQIGFSFLILAVNFIFRELDKREDKFGVVRAGVNIFTMLFGLFPAIGYYCNPIYELVAGCLLPVAG